MNNTKLDEKTMLNDALNSEKFIAGIYNANAMECATPSLKSCFCGILEDEQQMQQEIFNEMNSRGLYPVETAKEEKILQTKQTYGQSATN